VDPSCTAISAYLPLTCISIQYKALTIEHPSQKLRDTADLGTKLNGGYTPLLKNVVQCGLQVTIQHGEHPSVCHVFHSASDHSLIFSRSRMLGQRWGSTGCIEKIGTSLWAWAQARLAYTCRSTGRTTSRHKMNSKIFSYMKTATAILMNMIILGMIFEPAIWNSMEILSLISNHLY